jgi:hypothetical protein
VAGTVGNHPVTRWGKLALPVVCGLWLPRIPSGLVMPPTSIRRSDRRQRRCDATPMVSDIRLEVVSHRERGQLTQGPVRPVAVVVGHVLGQDVFEISTAEDEHPVEALTTNRPDEPLGECIDPRCSDRYADDPDASALKTSSKLEVNLASRSRMRNLTGWTRSTTAMVRFLACWTIQDPVGRAVLPVR